MQHVARTKVCPCNRTFSIKTGMSHEGDCLCNMSPIPASWQVSQCVANFKTDTWSTIHVHYVDLQEWLWCIGPFLRARLYFAKTLHGKKGLEQTVERVKNILARHKMEITSSPWRSLPELTNAGGAPCYDGCPAQAWSVACIIDVLYDMEKLVKDN